RQSKRATPAAAVSTTATTTAPASSTTTATTLGVPNISYVATATVASVDVYDDPAAATPAHTFKNPWLVNDDPKAKVPLVFLVAEQRDDGWIQVLLPIRPNGSKGWLKKSTVKVTPTTFHITVQLGAHTIT